MEIIFKCQILSLQTVFEDFEECCQLPPSPVPSQPNHCL